MKHGPQETNASDLKSEETSSLQRETRTKYKAYYNCCHLQLMIPLEDLERLLSDVLKTTWYLTRPSKML